LQEKRREAYVTFLTATRDTYDAIEQRGRRSYAPRVTEDLPEPDSPTLTQDRTAIDQNFGKVKRAKDILAVVGPKEMEELGDAVMARLSLDRIYYSPTGWSQREKDRERILRYAGATDNPAFLAAMRNVYDDQGAPISKRTSRRTMSTDLMIPGPPSQRGPVESFATRSRTDSPSRGGVPRPGPLFAGLLGKCGRGLIRPMAPGRGSTAVRSQAPIISDPARNVTA
jgi:hypothetical protein